MHLKAVCQPVFENLGNVCSQKTRIFSLSMCANGAAVASHEHKKSRGFAALLYIDHNLILHMGDKSDTMMMYTAWKMAVKRGILP